MDFRNFLRKIFERRSAARGGYFLIFFALVLTIVTLPIMAQVLERTVGTRSDIARFRDADAARKEGNGLLETVLQKNSKHGLGYYEIGTVDSRDGGLTVEYFYSAASVIPVPTSHDLGISAECDSESNIQLLAYDCEGVAVNGDAVVKREEGSGRPNFYYTVPALGTGNAAEDCKMNELNIDKETPSGKKVDPLDDPCNWNTLALGETVEIPLYVRNPENPDEIIIHRPENLKLRVRFRCENGVEICDAEDRLVIDEEGIDVNDLASDASKRVMNWVISSGNVFTPDVRWPAGDDPRPLDNNEITVNRLRFSGFGAGTLFNFSYDVGDSYSLVNLLNVFLKDISVAFRDSNPYENTLGDMYSALGANLAFLPSAPNYSVSINGLVEDGFFGPSIIMQFIDDVYVSQSGKPLSVMEYQIVTDVPLANNKFIIDGDSVVESSQSKYVLTEKRKRGPKADAPGLVFGN